MKSTGIVRKTDVVGRLVIPKEVRDELDINIGDGVEIYVEGENIVLRKHEDNCSFCKNSENLQEYCGKYVCADCIKKLTGDR